jgi:hypothetical protein
MVSRFNLQLPQFTLTELTEVFHTKSLQDSRK